MRGIELVRSGKIDREPLVSHAFPLDQAPEAFATQAKPGAAIKTLIKPWSNHERDSMKITDVQACVIGKPEPHSGGVCVDICPDIYRRGHCGYGRMQFSLVLHGIWFERIDFKNEGYVDW